VSRFVIDASIVLSWCFLDENSAAAQQAAENFKRGDKGLVTSFWPHEVLNALLMGEKRKRISANLIRSFLDDLVILPIELAPSEPEDVFSRIQLLSLRHNLTAYDAAYLDLAMENHVALATLDQDLIRAAKAEDVRLLT
jgi:predicted nucleic acid-binding protein